MQCRTARLPDTPVLMEPVAEKDRAGHQKSCSEHSPITKPQASCNAKIQGRASIVVKNEDNQHSRTWPFRASLCFG